MNYEGVYRKTGGMGQTKLITQCFERGQDFDLEDVDKFNDLAAVTSCMKNFFRSLPDPLFTHDLHESFVSSVGVSSSAPPLYKALQVNGHVWCRAARGRGQTLRIGTESLQTA
jgi:hypothetical protein